jgi:prepilin-type N-terminal cleavage/methylation domain-containing protein
MQTRTATNQSGFSLLELIIAMAVTLTIVGLSSTLLASSFIMSSREDR